MAGPSLDSLAEAPYTTSELRSMCEGGRKLFRTAADLLVVDAAELNVMLRRVQGNPWLLGMDSRQAARRVTRHLVRAASASTEAAAEMVRCWATYQSLYLNPEKTPSGRAFRVNQ